MAIHVNGVSMRAVSPLRVLVTGDPPVVTEAVRPGTDMIVHLAALTRVLPSIGDPAVTCRVKPVYDVKSGLSAVWPEFSEGAK
jgi:hypothetical protein